MGAILSMGKDCTLPDTKYSAASAEKMQYPFKRGETQPQHIHNLVRNECVPAEHLLFGGWY